MRSKSAKCPPHVFPLSLPSVLRGRRVVLSIHVCGRGLGKLPISNSSERQRLRKFDESFNFEHYLFMQQITVTSQTSACQYYLCKVPFPLEGRKEGRRRRETARSSCIKYTFKGTKAAKGGGAPLSPSPLERTGQFLDTSDDTNLQCPLQFHGILQISLRWCTTAIAFPPIEIIGAEISERFSSEVAEKRMKLIHCTLYYCFCKVFLVF